MHFLGFYLNWKIHLHAVFADWAGSAYVALAWRQVVMMWPVCVAATGIQRPGAREPSDL